MNLDPFVSGSIRVLPNACETGEITGEHEHNFDHTTIFMGGKWRVTKGDKTVYREAPSHLLIEAGVKHKIECLESGIYWCVYSHRLPNGEVVAQYTGWEKAYG